MIDRLSRMFEKQAATWPLLARGLEALRDAQNRPLDINGYTVWLRHLPHRITSTTAAVDRASIQNRPCFLCKANLPPEESGIAVAPGFTAYCNPFPIIDRHLTIMHDEHRPQRIAGQFASFIELAQALPGYLVIYNGPECGASAPDHLHFQACSAAALPIIRDVGLHRGATIPDYARRVWVMNPATAEVLEKAVARWNRLAPRDPEPLFNLAAFEHAGAVTALLFPRSKHRPQAFYTGKFTVSPATIDLCGVFVAPVEKDFQLMSAADVREIYEEVSIGEALFDQLIGEGGAS